MEVKLLTTPKHLAAMEFNAAYAMLTCHANTKKLIYEEPRMFFEKAIKAGHESILEHITLTYEVTNLSRACLQELSRHRHISLSVESTRHTLRKKSLNRDSLFKKEVLPKFHKALRVFLNDTNVWSFDSNDEIKYFVPEFWPTNLIMTANIRELRHIVRLRTAPAALGEFQELARAFVSELPDDFKYLLEDCAYKKEENHNGN